MNKWTFIAFLLYRFLGLMFYFQKYFRHIVVVVFCVVRRSIRWQQYTHRKLLTNLRLYQVHIDVIGNRTHNFRGDRHWLHIKLPYDWGLYGLLYRSSSVHVDCFSSERPSTFKSNGKRKYHSQNRYSYTRMHNRTISWLGTGTSGLKFLYRHKPALLVKLEVWKSRQNWYVFPIK